MTPQEGYESVSGKFLYGVFCLDQLEQVCLMGLFLMVNVSGLISAVMASNGPQLHFISSDDNLFHIG